MRLYTRELLYNVRLYDYYLEEKKERSLKVARGLYR